ncbi:hypothetical protein H2204_005757 [Knufia peltigerae]|uniref:Uncharacterized protein n=1 Tax=Knufia peltigerae TaxID=1002370 RepID=A0AA38Y527_9EURO|nr:hypothetical protein H2204_005757 [Knufia peltigerae]
MSHTGSSKREAGPPICAFLHVPLYAAHSSSSTSPPPSSPTSLRPLSPRSYQSHPIAIKDLPDSSYLLSGPGLSPPPPIRFRVLGSPPSISSSVHQHKRARSAPKSLGSSVLGSSSNPYYYCSSGGANRKSSNSSNHNRTKSAPELTTTPPNPNPKTSPQEDAIQLCDRDHCDHPVRGAGDSGLCHLCGPEPSQSLRQEGKGTGRRRGMNNTRTLRQQKVRFKLDDDDDDVENDPNPPPPPQAEAEEEEEGERSISGLLRFEDERDSWF